jgi:hypothetical protein
MKDKDQLFLEGILDKIQTPDQNEQDVYEAIAKSFNEYSTSSPNIFKYLNYIKKNNDIKGLLSYLNQNEYWVAKDKLIELLFQL